MAAVNFTSARFSAEDDNGRPLIGGKLYTFQNGSTTPAPTFKDEAGQVPNTNPVILDARGEAVVYLQDTQVYTFVLQNRLGALVWSQDGISGATSSIDFSDFTTALQSGDGSAQVGFTQVGTDAVDRIVQDKLRESVSLADYGGDLAKAFAALGGTEGTGYGVGPIDLRLNGATATFTGDLFVPVNVSIIGPGTVESAAGRLIFRNPFNSGSRGYTEYWPFMTSSNACVKFKCLTIINMYIGSKFDDCVFQGLVFVNSSALWTEFNQFLRCTFNENAVEGFAILFDGNDTATSEYATTPLAGADSFGYNSFTECKTASTAPTVAIKVVGGGIPYNLNFDFRVYVLGNGGAFLYIQKGRVASSVFNLRLETFGASGNVIALENTVDAQLWYNTGDILSASPEATFVQGALADVRANDINVMGCVLHDSSGGVVFGGDTMASQIVTHCLQRYARALTPAFSAFRAGADQAFASNAATRVGLTGEEFDTNGYFDSVTNHRFAPKISGYYQINAIASLGVTTVAQAVTLSIYKNGAAYKSVDPGNYKAPDTPVAASVVARSLSTLVYMNGTTDYLEMYVYVFDNGASPGVKPGAAVTSMNGILLMRA